MHGSHSGFIAPLLLVFIAVLLIGGGAYVYTQNKQENPSAISSNQATSTSQIADSSALPVIFSVSPTRIVPWGKSSGTKFTITGKNFDYVYPSSCDPYSCKTNECLQQECLQQNHVFFKITNSSGHSLIVEDYPSLGPGDFSVTEIIGSSAYNGNHAWEPVLPGQYLLNVSVDGRGTSNSVPITITDVNEAVAPEMNTPVAQPDPFQGLSKEQQQALALARSKARDALIQSDLSTIQSQAKMNYSDVGKTYTDFCTDPFVVNALTNIRTATGITPTTCNPSAVAFAASSPLATDSTKFWCVDSTGFSGKIAIPLGAKTSCSAPSTISTSLTPTLTFTASPATISSGYSSLLSWYTNNTTSCISSGSEMPSPLGVNGSIMVSPIKGAVYTLTCTGPGGSVTQSVTVNVNP